MTKWWRFDRRKRVSVIEIVVTLTTDTLRRRDRSERHRKPRRKGVQNMTERMKREDSA